MGETQTLKNEIEQLRLLVDLEEGAVDDGMQQAQTKDQHQRASEALLEKLKESLRTKLDALERTQKGELDRLKAKSFHSLKGLDAELAAMIDAHEQGLLGKFAEDFGEIRALSNKVERDASLSDEERSEL